MCIKCNISSNAREKIAITICILNGLIALFGIALIGMAIYMKINIESRMMLLDGYDTDVLPHFLLAVGIKVVVLHIITFKIVYDCSTSELRGRCVNFLFLAVILSFILVWFLLAGGLMCFTHRSVIEESLQNGLGYVMKRYKTDMFVKVTLDKLQQEYHCCGSSGYGDWFEVNWVNEEFLNTKHPDIIRNLKGGLFYSDDVPYSCCDVTSPRPCVHHAVKDKSMHVHYGSVTLYKSGCSDVLMDFFENRILVPTGWSVISAFFLQFVTMVLMRYLQTSLADARDMEDPRGEGAGYCIPGCPCDCFSTAGDPMKYVKRKRRSTDDVEDGMGGTAPDFMGGTAPDFMGGTAPDFMGRTAPDFDRDDSYGRDQSTDKYREDKKNRRKDKKDKKEKDKRDKKGKDKKEKKGKDKKDKKGKDKKGKDKSKERKDKKSKTKGKGSPKSKMSPKKKTSPKAKKSPKRSPTRSPKQSPKRSPTRSPKQSPKRSLKQSPRKPKSSKKLKGRRR